MLELDGPHGRPRLPGRPLPRRRTAGSAGTQCYLNDAHSARGLPRDRSRGTRPSTPSWSGSSAAAGRSTPSERGRRAGPTSTRSCPDRPAFFDNRDGHGAWVNSRALELAGITRETPDPPDGRIERDASGEPQGTLHEDAMDARRATSSRPRRRSEWEDGILRAQEDAPRTRDHGLAGRTIDRSGHPGRLPRGRRAGRADDARRGQPPLGDRRLAPTTTSRSSSSCAGGRVGRPAPDPRREDLRRRRPRELHRRAARAVRRHRQHRDLDARAGRARARRHLLDAHGFQVHMHTIGDRAVRDALDAIEAAAAGERRRDARHHLAHVQLVHPDDLPRFARARRRRQRLARSGPAAAPTSTELTEPFIGPERSAPHVSVRQPPRAQAPGSRSEATGPCPPRPAPADRRRGDAVYPETRDAKARSSRPRRSTSRRRSRPSRWARRT